MSKNIGNLQDKSGNSLFPNVIDTVSNSNGTALKFADGTMICYTKVKTTNQNTTYHYLSTSWVYPISFVETPICIATVSNWNTYLTSTKTNAGITETQVMCWFMSPSGVIVDTITEAYINVLVIGKWK